MYGDWRLSRSWNSPIVILTSSIFASGALSPPARCGGPLRPNAGNGLGGACVGTLPDCGVVGAPCCASGPACIANATCGNGTCQQCVVEIAVGVHHTCAIKLDGTVWCTGANTNGQLGQGTVGGLPSTAWVQVHDTGLAPIHDATAIAAGSEHTCALRAAGAVSCWGHDDDGQLGNGTSGTDL